jgi:hypothetical protein
MNAILANNENENKNTMASPGLEPETFSVLDWRDNQLHHDTIALEKTILTNYCKTTAITFSHAVMQLHSLFNYFPSWSI